MRRLGVASLLVASLVSGLVACDRSSGSTPPDSTGAAEVEAAPAPAPEPEPEPESEPEPEPEPAATEVSKVAEAVVEKDGFVARDLQCSLDVPTADGDRYILASLTDPAVDAALDACAPKGAAIEVEWSYMSGQAGDISVVATSGKQASCIAAAMTKVHAGVTAKCSAVLLIGDLAAATAAYEAR